jgi:hypothetical protein
MDRVDRRILEQLAIVIDRRFNTKPGPKPLLAGAPPDARDP